MIEDVISMALTLMPSNNTDTQISGIFNIGTSKPKSFEDIALSISNGPFNYIDMPLSLQEHYQTYTCADLSLYDSII